MPQHQTIADSETRSFAFIVPPSPKGLQWRVCGPSARGCGWDFECALSVPTVDHVHDGFAPMAA